MSAVNAKAVVNSEKSKIMLSTAAYERIAEVPSVALQWAENDPKRTYVSAAILVDFNA